MTLMQRQARMAHPLRCPSCERAGAILLRRALGSCLVRCVDAGCAYEWRSKHPLVRYATVAVGERIDACEVEA